MAEPLGVDARLRLARQVLSPSDEHQRRVRSALAARLAAEGQTATLPVRAVRVGRRIASPRLSRALEAAALVAAGFGLGVWFAETRAPETAAPSAARALADAEPREEVPPEPAREAPLRAEPSQQPASPSPPQAEPAVALSASSSAAAEASNARSRPAKPSSTGAHGRERTGAPSRAAAADGFAEELSLLRRAERATRSGDALLARSLIAELDARFPKTALRQERAALLVLVACATGEPAAQAGAREFMERHEQSVHLDRIRSACQLDSAGSDSAGSDSARSDSARSTPE
jgi:hypothetical protein